MEVILSLAIVLSATVIILNLGGLSGKSPFSVSNLDYINIQAKFQALLFGVAVLVLVAIYFVNPDNFSLFIALGDIAAPATTVSWLGIPEGMSWLTLGGSLVFIITFGTSTFVYLQFRNSGGNLWQLVPFIPWILLFSLTNSFSEEVVFRLGIIVPLAGSIEADNILLISAVIFGAPHLRGMPNGIIGALMAGFLGWLLAKSVVETNGVFWAWGIHLLQDIVIFTAFVMAAANKSLNLTSGSLRAPEAG